MYSFSKEITHLQTSNIFRSRPNINGRITIACNSGASEGCVIVVIVTLYLDFWLLISVDNILCNGKTYLYLYLLLILLFSYNWLLLLQPSPSHSVCYVLFL